MESLGYLGVVDTNNTSPLWPKVYFVTRRGLVRLKQALHEQGQEWSEILYDRKRSEGVSAQHVLHELFITEFLLMAWETTQTHGDLEILSMQRRSLAKHDAFKVVVAGRPTRLQPDGMFLYRQQGKGMMCCFVELDIGSMSPRQLDAKFRHYHAWAESAAARTYLKGLYERHGANNPTANFRILIVTGVRNRYTAHRRLAQLLRIVSDLPTAIRDRTWISTVQQLDTSTEPRILLTESFWMRWRDVQFQRGK